MRRALDIGQQVEGMGTKAKKPLAWISVVKPRISTHRLFQPTLVRAPLNHGSRPWPVAHCTCGLPICWGRRAFGHFSGVLWGLATGAVPHISRGRMALGGSLNDAQGQAHQPMID